MSYFFADVRWTIRPWEIQCKSPNEAALSRVKYELKLHKTLDVLYIKHKAIITKEKNKLFNNCLNNHKYGNVYFYSPVSFHTETFTWMLFVNQFYNRHASLYQGNQLHVKLREFYREMQLVSLEICQTSNHENVLT